MSSGTGLEQALRPLLQPVEGQYPRPWMTAHDDPASCRVFIVGANQAKRYDAHAVESFDAYCNALFNRGDETCRALYDRMTEGQPSPTRRNLDAAVNALSKVGIRDVLETNVVCYSTPMSADLGLGVNARGREQGEAIFRLLLEHTKPAIVWVHGAGAAKRLRSVVPGLPHLQPGEGWTWTRTANRPVIVTRSLAPPAANMWLDKREAVFNEIADFVVRAIGPT
jgi:hypothetical protein